MEGEDDSTELQRPTGNGQRKRVEAHWFGNNYSPLSSPIVGHFECKQIRLKDEKSPHTNILPNRWWYVVPFLRVKVQAQKMSMIRFASSAHSENALQMSYLNLKMLPVLTNNNNVLANKSFLKMQIKGLKTVKLDFCVTIETKTYFFKILMSQFVALKINQI